jgi:hypothetical protein
MSISSRSRARRADRPPSPQAVTVSELIIDDSAADLNKARELAHRRSEMFPAGANLRELSALERKQLNDLDQSISDSAERAINRALGMFTQVRESAIRLYGEIEVERLQAEQALRNSRHFAEMSALSTMISGKGKREAGNLIGDRIEEALRGRDAIRAKALMEVGTAYGAVMASSLITSIEAALDDLPHRQTAAVKRFQIEDNLEVAKVALAKVGVTAEQLASRDDRAVLYSIAGKLAVQQRATSQEPPAPVDVAAGS